VYLDVAFYSIISCYKRLLRCNRCYSIYGLLTPFALILQVNLFFWVREHLPLDPHDNTFYYIVIAIHYSLWLFTIYVAYFYSSSIPRPGSGNFGVANASNAQTVECNLIVQGHSCIILTNHNNIAFTRENRNKIVDGVTLPSGSVVPNGVFGKNWKMTGNSIMLL
jgi:hypothetical protein